MNHLPPNDIDHILLHTKDLWGELRRSKVFITGGTGFFGKWLLESFLTANDRFKLKASITVLSRNPEKFKRETPHLAGHPAVCLIKGDVRNFVFPKGNFTHLIHGAADASLKLIQEEPLFVFDTIIQGTRRILEFCATRGVKKALMISSGAVYGRQPADLIRIPESFQGAPDPTNQQSVYGEGKRAAEMMCAIYAKQCGLNVVLARGFAFIGPYLPFDTHYAAGNFIRDALRGGPIRIQGDGTTYRSYLYAADLAVWLWTILIKGRSGQVYNVGSENALTIAKLARLVAAQCGKVEVKISQAPSPGKPVERYVPSTVKARTELGLSARIDITTAIRRTIAFYSAVCD